MRRKHSEFGTLQIVKSIFMCSIQQLVEIVPEIYGFRAVPKLAFLREANSATEITVEGRASAHLSSCLKFDNCSS